MKTLSAVLLALILAVLVLMLALPNSSRQRIRDAATSHLELSHERDDLAGKGHMTDRDWDRYNEIGALMRHQ